MSFTKKYSPNNSDGMSNNKMNDKYQWGGAPLKSTFKFLSIPAIILILVIGIGVKLPGGVLYGMALILGFTLFIHSLRDPEWLLAVFIMYIPLSKILVISIAPGINGTNVLILLMFISWFITAKHDNIPLITKFPYGYLVKWYALFSCFSVIPMILTDGGLSYLLEEVLAEYKAWLDQFIMFFLFLNMIRDGAMARRMVVYMMIGFLVVVVLGIQETLDKMGLSSIEKSRVLGPQLQPNDFGAFLVSGIAPFIGVTLIYMSSWRTWLLSPIYIIYIKILLSTFSRGAYLGLALAAVIAGYVKGRKFLVIAGILGIFLIILIPELIPRSLSDRIAQTQGNTETIDEVDASSGDRIILWKAAFEMTIESPVFGKGFKIFRKLKSQYTERQVPVSDTHNMYFFISSQMGIPALVFFILIFYRHYTMSVELAHEHKEKFARAIGIGGAAMVAALAAINMFGSRMVNIEVSGYFWIYLVVLMHLTVEHEKGRS